MSKIEELSLSDLNEDKYASTPSEVYLGFVDTVVKESDVITIEDTFIGGEPVWIHSESIPKDELLQCGSCKSKDHMKLLLQAFAPLDYEQVEDAQKSVGVNNMKNVNPDDDRVLYVFMCTKCQRKVNSVRCIRGVKKNKSTKVDTITKKMEEVPAAKEFNINPFDLSKDSSNPFGANPFQNNNSSNPFGGESTLTSTVPAKTEKPAKLSSKAARKLHDSEEDKKFDGDNCFKSFLLYVEQESFKNKNPEHLKLPKNLKIDKEALDLTGETEESLEKNPVKLDPRTEKLSKFLDDDTFQKFQEVVGYNPNQVIRYDFGGKPLLFAESKIDFLQIVANPAYNPSSKRVFEIQLMPTMILDLEENVSIKDGMEWGTIMIFSDVANFTPEFDEHGVGYVEEVVKVQWEIRE